MPALGYARAGFGCGGGAESHSSAGRPRCGDNAWAGCGSVRPAAPQRRSRSARPQPTRSRCGLPSPAPPLTSLPASFHASAAGAQGIRLSSPRRRCTCASEEAALGLASLRPLDSLPLRGRHSSQSAEEERLLARLKAEL